MSQLRTVTRRALGVLVAVGVLGMPGGTWGQTLQDLLSQAGEVQVVAPSPTPRTFGTATPTALVVTKSEFEPQSSAATWQYVAGSKFSTFGMVAGVRLPSGAVVQSVELEGCDTDSSHQITFFMNRTLSPNGASTGLTPTGGTGETETPGCGFFAVAPNPMFGPVVIDNATHTYNILMMATTSTTTLTAVRIYYSLQVSPAPAVASFNDVPPTHPFFRFVEALKASGITGGCQASPPLFCPDAPLTRGQMATFLSLALGLHFAP